LGKVRKIALTGGQRTASEAGFRSGVGHAFCKRCQLVLLKHEGRTSLAIGIYSYPSCITKPVESVHEYKGFKSVIMALIIIALT